MQQYHQRERLFTAAPAAAASVLAALLYMGGWVGGSFTSECGCGARPFRFVLQFSLHPACVTMLIARVDNIYQRVWYVAVAVIASGCSLRSFRGTFSTSD